MLQKSFAGAVRVPDRFYSERLIELAEQLEVLMGHQTARPLKSAGEFFVGARGDLIPLKIPAIRVPKKSCLHCKIEVVP